MTFGLLELRKITGAQGDGVDDSGLQSGKARRSETHRDVDDGIDVDAMLAQQQAHGQFLCVAAASDADFFADQIFEAFYFRSAGPHLVSGTIDIGVNDSNLRA